MKYLGPKTDGDDLATQSDVTGGGAGLSDATPDAITPDQSGAAGTATDAARADHVHAIAAAAAGTITGSNAEGSSTSFARADHDHALGAGVVGATQLASAVSEFLVPTGAVIPFAAATPPTGWLFCVGASVSRTTYADLFAAIGTTYGAGDGSTTFALPDLRTRVPVGRDFLDSPSDPDFDALNDQGGSKTHTLTTAEMPSHQHSYTLRSGNTGNNYVRTGGGQAISSLSTSTADTGSTGGGGAHNNLQPYIVLNYIIKT